MPQCLQFRLDGGGSEGDKGGEESVVKPAIGVVALLLDLGTVGLGHVRSWSASGQKGRILS